MAIRFTCSAGHRLKAADDKAGRKMLCPACQESVTVPEPNGDSDADLAAADPPQPPPVAAREEAGPPESLAAQTFEALAPSPPTTTEHPATRSSSAATARPLPAAEWTLAAGLALAVFFSLLPALGQWDAVPMPHWARAVYCIAALQGLFLLWMLTVRHWAASAVVACVFAAATIAYGAAAAYAFVGGDETFQSWDLDPAGSRAAVWSITVLALYLLATYFCGAAAVRQRAEQIEGTDR